MGVPPEKSASSPLRQAKEGKRRRFLWEITNLFTVILLTMAGVLLYNTLNFYAEGQAYVDRGRVEGL